MRNCRSKILNGKKISCIFLLPGLEVFNHRPQHLFVIHTMLKLKVYEKGLISELSALQATNTLWYKKMNRTAHFLTPSSFWFTSFCLSSLRRPYGRVYLSMYIHVKNMSWKDQRKGHVLMRLEKTRR